jgi:hypothetical protein
MIPGMHSMTIRWQKADGPVTYYMVAYGRKSGIWEYGAPNVGGPDTTEYTVKGLVAGEKYYFAVRAVNGCAPGPLSAQYTSAPAGTTLAGSQPLVLGTTEKRDLKPFTIIDSNVIVRSMCWWWLVLPIMQGLIMTVYLRKLKNPNAIAIWLMPIALAIVSFSLDQFVAHRFVTPSPMCAFMWLWATLGSMVPMAVKFVVRPPKLLLDISENYR